jgi:death-on-curing protein
VNAEEIDYLSVEDLLEIAAGVIDHVVVRDAGLLAAAVGRPQVTVFGDDAYSTFEDKAAALLHSLVRNHALVDGNKRLAWSAARVFCLLNGRELTYTVDEAEDLMLSAASGQVDVPQIAAWLLAHSASASFRRLRTHLDECKDGLGYALVATALCDARSAPRAGRSDIGGATRPDPSGANDVVRCRELIPTR